MKSENTIFSIICNNIDIPICQHCPSGYAFENNFDQFFFAIWWWQPRMWPWRPRSLKKGDLSRVLHKSSPRGPNCNKTGRVYLNLSTLDLVPPLLATSNFLLPAQSIHPMPSRSAVDHLHKFQNQRWTILMWRWRWLWGRKKRKKWEKNFLSCLHVKSTRGLGGVGGTAALLGSATLPSSIHVDFSSFQVSRFQGFHKHMYMSPSSPQLSLLFISLEVVLFGQALWLSMLMGFLLLLLRQNEEEDDQMIMMIRIHLCGSHGLSTRKTQKTKSRGSSKGLGGTLDFYDYIMSISLS